MDALVPFSIPVSGLRDGEHNYHFDIDRDFFAAFEASPIEEGAVTVDLVFDKRPSHYVLEFSIQGTVRTDCDRCLAAIDLPISSEERLLVKFSENRESEEADVIYISPDAEQFQVAQYVYEYVLLAVPIIKVYDCQLTQPLPCNEELLNRLAAESTGEAATGAEKEDQISNPIWEELKKWSENN